jgi:hypothetical protein
MRRLRGIALGLGFVMAASAQAKIVAYGDSAVIVSTTRFGLFPGDPIDFVFSLDLDRPDYAPDANRGYYLMSTAFAVYADVDPPEGDLSIACGNVEVTILGNDPARGDVYEIAGNGCGAVHPVIVLEDPTHQAIAGIPPPYPPPLPDLARFAVRELRIIGNDVQLVARIPEPTLAGPAALLALAVLRRRTAC